MKAVSAAYKESMKALMRNRSYVWITFQNIDVGAAKDGSWESNGAMDWSSVDTLDYRYDYRGKHATLELNRWGLDGSMSLLPPDKDGFVSSMMSDENGTFATPAVLTREFSEGRDLPGLTLTFDSRLREHPDEISIVFYSGDTVINEQTVEITDYTVMIPITGLDVTKIEITFNKALPYRRPRMERIVFGDIKEFENKDLVSTQTAGDVDPLSRRLPKESFKFTLLDYGREYDPDNPTGIYAYIDEKSPISIQFGYELPSGEVEWLENDNYVLDSKPTVKNSLATFKGTGLIGGMTDTFYKSCVGEKTFYAMAEEVLLDADLTLTSTGENPWVIHESLKTMTTTAVLPIATHMECLQLIAHACRCRLYTDSENIIHLEPFVLSTDRTDFVMDFSTIQKNSQSVSKIEQLKAVTVAKYSYVADTEPTTIYEGETTETALHVEFDGLAQDVEITVSGGTLVSGTVYGRAADLVMSEGTKSITITGTLLSEKSSVLTYPVNTKGETDVEENPLITTDAMASALAAHTIAYLQLRNTYDVKYRGNPELEVGDVIGLQTPFSDDVTGLILTDSITFDGALSGSMKIKAVST